MKFLILILSLSVISGENYEESRKYSGPLAGEFPMVPGAASGGLVPDFSADVAAARAKFASLGGVIVPAPMVMNIGSSSSPSSYGHTSSQAASKSFAPSSSPVPSGSGTEFTYSGPLAGVFTLVPGAASGGLVPDFAPAVAAARAEFASLGGQIVPAPMTVTYGSSSSPSSSSLDTYSISSSSSSPNTYGVSSPSSATFATNSGSEFTYSGPLAGVFPLVPGAASGGLVPDFSPEVAAARAEFASLGGAVDPAIMEMAPSSAISGSPSSSFYLSPAPADNGLRYSGPMAGVLQLVPASASGGLVPAETAAVAAARADHSAAKAKAAMENW